MNELNAETGRGDAEFYFFQEKICSWESLRLGVSAFNSLQSGVLNSNKIIRIIMMGNSKHR